MWGKRQPTEEKPGDFTIDQATRGPDRTPFEIPNPLNRLEIYFRGDAVFQRQLRRDQPLATLVDEYPLLRSFHQRNLQCSCFVSK